jgi:hypothetical protein
MTTDTSPPSILSKLEAQIAVSQEREVFRGSSIGSRARLYTSGTEGPGAKRPRSSNFTSIDAQSIRQFRRGVSRSTFLR